MNKKLAAFLITGMMSVTATGMSFAATPNASMDDTTPAATQTRSEHNSGIFDTQSSEAENPNAGDTNAGPVIKVKKDKFLVEKGGSFDFGKELGLSIVDETDGDMTNQIKVPDIPTDKTGKVSKTVKAVNSKGEISTKNIVINVVEVAKEAKVSSLDDVKGMDLSKLVTGDVSSLTIALKSTDEANKTMTITVSDGVNTLDKTVKLTIDGEAPVEEGKDPTAKPEGENAEGEVTEGEEAGTKTEGEGNTNGDGSSTGGSSNGNASLPQTGAVASTGIIGLIAASVGGGTYYLKRRK